MPLGDELLPGSPSLVEFEVDSDAYDVLVVTEETGNFTLGGPSEGVGQIKMHAADYEFGSIERLSNGVCHPFIRHGANRIVAYKTTLDFHTL